MDRSSLDRSRARFRAALDELREPDDDFDEITEVTHPAININVRASQPDSDPPLPRKWKRAFTIGAAVAGFLTALAAGIWNVLRHR